MKPAKQAGRVLVFAEYGVLNGAEQSFLAVSECLTRQGWQILVALPPNSEFEAALNHQGIETHPFHLLGVSSQAQKRARIANVVADLVPDLVHFNSLSMSRLGGPVTRQMEVPSIGHMRDIMNVSHQAISDINQVDRVIAVSKAVASCFQTQGIHQDRIFVVYNGVDTSRFEPAHSGSENRIRQELGLTQDCQLLLFVGQIGMRKGVDLLLDVFESLLEFQSSSLHLIMIGERTSTKDEAIEFEKTLRLRSSRGRLAGHVHWLGRRSDVDSVMKQASLLIHPARQEPLGRVLLESLASGLPVVTTNVGGSPEIFSDLERFDLLMPVEASAIATRCRQLLDEPELLEEIGQAERRVALEKFSNDECAEETGRIYDSVSTRSRKMP